VAERSVLPVFEPAITVGYRSYITCGRGIETNLGSEIVELCTEIVFLVVVINFAGAQERMGELVLSVGVGMLVVPSLFTSKLATGC